MNLTKVDLKDALVAQYETAIEKSNGIPANIKARRKEALATFEKLGFPTTKQEEYKYTSFSNILKQEYQTKVESKLQKSDIQSFYLNATEVNRVVIVNGVFNSDLSELKDKHLKVQTFAEADPNLLEKYFAKDAYTARDPFAELNTSGFDEGIFIKVTQGKMIEKPVVIHFITDASTQKVFTQPRLLILAEQGSQARFAELYNTVGSEAAFSNVVCELVMETDAVIDYYKLQNDIASAAQVNTTVITLEGKSVFSGATITLNGSMIRNNLNVILKAEHSEASFYGLYYLKDKQLTDNHTMVDHAVPNCVSNELYKGILDEKSTGVFNGKIFVKQDAQKTNAFQSNKNILLSRDATMNTKPQLEIFADDVKCSHGATIGQLEEEPLFYLRSRGMSEDSAKALLLVAFAQDIIDHIKIEPLQQYLSKAIEERLSDKS